MLQLTSVTYSEKMVNKCAVFGCKRGYENQEQLNEDYHAFYFPSGEKKEHLLPAWVKFVCRQDWKPTKNSVICEFHFDETLINKGNQSLDIEMKVESRSDNFDRRNDVDSKISSSNTRTTTTKTSNQTYSSGRADGHIFVSRYDQRLFQNQRNACSK